MPFDIASAIPVKKGGGGQIEPSPTFDISSARSVDTNIFSDVGAAPLMPFATPFRKVGEKPLETIKVGISIIRWPFWRFIEHPVSTVATAVQQPEGKTVGGTLARATQAYIPFREIPVEEYGSYGQIWRNYYKAMTNGEPPTWYLAMASYGTAMGIEPPIIRGFEKTGELALTRAAKPYEADIIRKAFEPLKTSLEQRGLNLTDLHKEGNIIKLSEKSELYINKYVSAVLRGDEIRIPRWSKIEALPIPAEGVSKIAEQALIAGKTTENLPITGPEIIISPPGAMPNALKHPLPLAIRLKSGNVIVDETANLHADIITKEGINPDDVKDVGFVGNKGYQATKLPDEKGGEPIQGNWKLGQEREFAFDPNSTKNEGRFRLYPSEEMQSGAYRSQTSIKSRGIEETSGVRFMLGKTIDGESVIQTIRFNKSQFTEEQATQWWEENKDKFEFYQKALPEVPKELLDKVKGIVKEKITVTPEKIKLDVSGITPLQRQIQAMEERQTRVESAKYALEEINTIREYFRRRITKYKDGYLKEELTGIPGIYITKEGGIKPDEVMDELRENFNIEITDENELKQYLINLEQSRKDLLAEIKSNKPELITKRETTLLNQRIKATEQGLKEGRIQTKEEIEAVQAELIQAIEDAKLPLDERAKFLRAIKNIQTKKDLAKEFPKIAERLQEMKEKQARGELVSEIKKIAERAKVSQAIAVDYADLIQNVVDRFELKGHLPETIEELQKTKKYIQQAIKEGKEIDMPEDVLKKLEILERKPFKEITAQELEDLRDTVEELELLGKTKLRLRQMAYERKKAGDLIKLKTDATPIISKEKIKAGIGERLNEAEKLKNKLTSVFNTMTEKKIALTPMDAIFDELDGQKNYKGANFTIFKKTVDKHFSDWFDLSDKHTTKVRELAKDLDETNFERIAIYATTQQEGGLEKLQSMGFTEKEVSKIILTDKEQALLDEMRKQFDATWPQVSEIMRTVYNKPFAKVKFYFPFMTDYDAMTDFEIRDRFGDTPEHTRFLKKNVEMGFTKERVGGKQEIKLNAMEVFMRHIDNTTYLMTIGKDIKYLNDLAATEEYKEAVGDVGQEIVREWLDLIARKGRMAGDRVPLFDAMRKYTSGVYLSFKLSSALVQFTSLFDGAALIGNYAFEGTQMITHKEIRNFLKENFPEWRKRIADDPAFMDFYKDDTILDKAIRLGISPLKLFDSLTAGSVTIGAYKKYCIENGIEFDITKPDKNGIDYAQLIMRRTQASGFFKDVPLALSKGNLTGNISLDKILLQFQSFLLNRWSLITHDLYKAGIKGENKKQALNIAMWLILATLAEAGMRRMLRKGIKAIKGEKEDENKEKTLAGEIFANALQNISFMGYGISAFYYGSLGIPSIDWLNRAAGYSSAGFKSKTSEAKMRNFMKGMALLLPGGSQMIQMFPATEEKEGLSRGKKLKR